MAKLVAHVNIRGLKGKRHEVTNFLHHYDVDVLSLNETFLTPNDSLTFPEYTLISQPRGGRGGGVAFLLKNTINHDILHKDIHPNEHITLRLNTVNNLPFTITTVYCPNQTHPPHNDLFDLLDTHSTRNLILGDFNAKHPDFGSITSNPNGRALSDIVVAHNLTLLNDDSPTYISPTGIPYTLDFALCTPLLVPTIRDFRVTFDLSSDHYPMFLSLTTPIQLNAPGPHAPLYRKNYAHTDWTAYADHLRDSLPAAQPLSTEGGIDDFVDRLTASITSALDASTPAPRPTRRTKTFLLPPPILRLIRTKNRLRKEYQRTRNPDTKLTINRLTNTIKRRMTDYHTTRWVEACTKVNNHTPPQDRWKIFRRLTGNSRRAPYPTLSTDDVTANTDQAKADLFNLTMDRTQRDHNDPNFNLPHRRLVDRTVARNSSKLDPLPNPPNPPPHDLTTPFTPLEVYQALKHTKNTSPGTDGIPFKALKSGPPSLLPTLAHLFTACLYTGYFPRAWKIARLCMIPKPNKDPRHPKNYRPISLLSTLGKTLERVIKNRIYPHLENTNFFNPHQAGFRSKRSTVDQLLYYTETVYEGFNHRKFTSSVFLDVEKAFDTVWHSGLRFKILQTGLPPSLTRILSNFLSDRRVFTEVNGYRSGTYCPRAGVPQGSVLSPLLFIIFTNDIPPPTRHIRLSQFADDLAIWSTSSRPYLALDRLQHYLNRLQRYCNDWRIKLNPQKTTLLNHYRLKPRHPVNDPIYLLDQPIHPSPTAKFLGLTLSKNLNWISHFDDIRAKASYRITLLRRVVARGRGSHPDTNVQIYKQFIRPLFEYGSPATRSIAPSSQARLQTLQNTALTTALHLPRTTSSRYTHALTHTPLVLDRLQALSLNFVHPDRIRHKPKIRKRVRALRNNPPDPPPRYPSPLQLTLL